MKGFTSANSLIRGHFRRDGKPKQGYRTKEDADAAAELRGGPGNPMRGYKCDFCKWWHIGGTR